ncbi:MAG: hypothetical protein ACR2IS_19705 [Nitrososphaeraceae archaeon]
MSTMADMFLGMLFGMIASPVMMKAIKSLLQRRKVNRLLKEAANEREKMDIDSKDDQKYRIL